MNRRVITSAILAAGMTLPSVAGAAVVNFAESDNGAFPVTGGAYDALYYGQGAYSDPGNNVWNGFGNSPGPGSTYFYGTAHPDSNSTAGAVAVPAGNPGNPYASFKDQSTPVSSTGTRLFSPASYTATNVGNATSAGSLSTVTLSVRTPSGTNGGATPTNQGTPSFFLGDAALATTTPGTFSLGAVPTGTYDLFLYGANFDGTRGAAFAVSSGTALGGFTATTNSNANAGSGPLTTYALGVDYVEFTNVTPDATGVISGTWGAVSNPISGLSGEGDFNGLQLVSVAVPEPTSIGLIAAGGSALLLRRRKTHLERR